MNPCKACMTLNGQHSETRPHGDLRLEGTGVFGTPREPIRRYVQSRCHTCGSWLRQNTERGDPAGLWSLQDPSGRASVTRDETVKDEHAGRAVEWLKNTIESAKGNG